MTEEEYWESNKKFESEPPEDDDLPSTFLSDEDIADSTNVVMIPNYKLNIDLILDNYVDQITKVKNKTELKDALFALWNRAAFHGAISERLDKLQTDVEMLQFDILSMAGYEIEFVDEDEE